MSTWKRGRHVSVSCAKRLKGDVVAWRISLFEGDDLGYTQSDVDVRFGKDGHVSLNDGNYNSIYLYPSQVKKLRGLIRNIPQPKIPAFVPRKMKKP